MLAALVLYKIDRTPEGLANRGPPALLRFVPVLWPPRNYKWIFAAALPRKAEDAGGLTPGKDDNAVGQERQ